MAKQDKRKFFTTAQIKAASSVPIIDYVQAKGIGRLINQGSNYVKLEYDGHDSLVIDLKRNFFIHNSNQYDDNAKGNLINFIRYISGNTLSFRDAIAEVLEFKGEHVSTGQFVALEKKPFEYDFVQAKYNSRGRNYLVKERQIDGKLVDWLFQKGYIMQEAKYNNVVFNWTVDGKPPQQREDIIGATQQTTQPPREGQPSKWIKESSQSEMGFNVQLGDKTEHIYVFEAAIDLLSYWSIHKNQLQNCRLVSLEGVKERTFYHFLDQSYQANPEGFQVHICVDNDLAALKFVNHLMHPKEGSPIQYIEAIPHYYAINQAEAQSLKDLCSQYGTDYNMIGSVYMIERHFLDKGSPKEKDGCYFKDGLEKGIERLHHLFSNDFKAGVQQLPYDFLMKERIEHYYQAFQEGKIEEVLEVQKDWNDLYRYYNHQNALQQEQHIEKTHNIEPQRTEQSIQEKQSEAPVESLQNVEEFVKTKTERLTKERVKEVASITTIDEKIMDIFAQKGWIRETQKKEFVFVWSHKGDVKGAEIVTLDNRRDIIHGSQREHSFTFTVGQTKSICLFDSPLEAMSFLNLYPNTQHTTFVCNNDKNDKSDYFIKTLKESLTKGEIHQVNLCTSNNDALLERLHQHFAMDKNFVKMDGKQVIVHSLVPVTQSWQQDVKGYKEYCQLAKLEKDIDQQLDHLKTVSPSQEVNHPSKHSPVKIDRNY